MDIRIIYVVISGWSIHRLQFSIICTASGKKRQQWRRTRRREGRYWTEKVWSDKQWATICTWRRRWERWDSWCTFCLNQIWWRTKNDKYQVWAVRGGRWRRPWGGSWKTSWSLVRSQKLTRNQRTIKDLHPQLWSLSKLQIHKLNGQWRKSVLTFETRIGKIFEIVD